MTSPEAFPPPSTLLPETGPPSASHPEFTAGADSFALELRAETIEQLSGGDALRRGENERIEAGGSHSNADLVVGRDRVQVQGTLAEHTGHGFAVQAAHLDTTVGGPSDTWAGKENTVLLAGHMCDTWNGGTATLAAMSDDTAAGGGVRATAVLDLWAHGLMGLEERPGTCTADGALFEACGTLYEREYRTAVHAAGLAVFNGTLYQSVRNAFQPLMRISMGVRNLIAGGGGGAGGDAPPAPPPPAAGGAGAQGAQAATDTLDAGRGAAEIPPTGTEAVHLDAAAVLARDANPGAAPNDLTELHRCADTAERLGGLRDALRGAEAGGEATGGARISGVEDVVCGPRADDAPGMLDGRSAAVAFRPVVPASRFRDPPAPGTKPKLGLLGGADVPVQLRPVDFDWDFAYGMLTTQREWYREEMNVGALRACDAAVSSIDARVREKFVEVGGTVEDVAQRPRGVTETEQEYRILHDMVRRAERAGDADRSGAIRRVLESIDQCTYEAVQALSVRGAEFDRRSAAVTENVGLATGIDSPFVRQLIEFEIRTGRGGMSRARSLGDTGAERTAADHVAYFEWVRNELAKGFDPRVNSRRMIDYLTEMAQDEAAGDLTARLIRLEVVLAEGAPFSPAVAGPSATVGTAAPRLSTPDPTTTGRVVEATAGAGPTPGIGPSGSSHAVPAGPDARDAAAPPVLAVETTTPQLGAESALWLHSVEPAQATSTVAPETGLPLAGESLPDVPLASEDVGVAFSGAIGETIPGPRPATSDVEFDLGFLDPPVPPWAADDFAVERALNAGLLPPGFDATRLIEEWSWLTRNTRLEGQLEGGLVPLQTIDAMVAGYRAVEQGHPFALIIQYLETMKDSIVRALGAAYGHRADPSWLASVDECLQTWRSDPAANGASATSIRVLDELIEGTQRVPPTGPRESPGVAGRLEAGAESILGEGDTWHRGPPGLHGSEPALRFGDGQAVGPNAESRAVAPAGARQGWRVGEAPGFGGLPTSASEIPFTRRERIVRRLMTGESLSQAQFAALSRRIEHATRTGVFGGSRPQSIAALLRDLSRLGEAARTSPAAASLEDIDWSALEALTRLLDASGSMM